VNLIACQKVPPPVLGTSQRGQSYRVQSLVRTASCANLANPIVAVTVGHSGVADENILSNPAVSPKFEEISTVQ
jgi:hypothetical protein